MSFRRQAAAGAGPWLTRLLRGRRSPDAGVRAIADPARVARILVLKPHDQLGDFLVATPALAALRARYPNARITLLTRAFLAGIARLQPDVDEVWVQPRVAGLADAVAFAGVVAEVARLRPDLAFVLNSVSRSRTADALAALSGARLVVGRSWVGDGPLAADAPGDPAAAAFAAMGRDGVYDLDLACAAASEHQSRRVLDLVRWTGADADWRTLRLALDDRARVAGFETIESAWRVSAPIDGPPSPAAARVRWIGIHPGAANPLKCWPLERFVELGVALARGGAADEDRRLIVFDSPRERGRATAVHAGLLAHGVRAAFVPPGAIAGFAAACAHLALLVCNDSGVMHIAAALVVPTVSFHALGRPVEWAPAHPRAAAFFAERAIDTLAVEPARVAAERLLA